MGGLDQFLSPPPPGGAKQYKGQVAVRQRTVKTVRRFKVEFIRAASKFS